MTVKPTAKPKTMLTGKTKAFGTKTLYISIPSKMAHDSAFTIKSGDSVILEFDPKKNQLVIFPVSDKKAVIR